MARSGVRRPGRRGLAGRRGRPPRRAPTRRDRGPVRGAAHARRTRRGDRRARSAHRQPPAPRAPMGAARAGVLPSRPPGGRAGRVPASPGDPGRRARYRPLTRAPPAPRTHPATEPGARDQRLAAPRVPAPRAHRLRQLRRRLARAPARGGQRRGGQGDPSAPGERSRLHPQVRDRGADRRSPRASARCPALRLLARTRRGVPRHAIPPGREPRPERSAPVRSSPNGSGGCSTRWAARSRRPTTKASSTAT